MKNNHWLKRIYARYTPYVQLTGWVIIAAPVVVSGIAIAQQALAFDSRITSLEQSKVMNDQDMALVNQKLDLIIEFWKIPRRR